MVVCGLQVLQCLLGRSTPAMGAILSQPLSCRQI